MSSVVNYTQGNYDDAYIYLSRYVELVPQHPGARKLLGKLLLKRRDLLEAIKVLEWVADTGSDDPEVLALLGVAYMRDRQIAKAASTFERAAELAPKHSRIRTQLALSRLATGDSAGAIEELEAAFSLDTNETGAGSLLGLVHLRTGDFTGTLETAQDLIERDPDNPYPYNLAGGAHFGSGNADAARESFETALEIDPDYLPAAMNLAALDLAAGDIESAEESYHEIIARQPEATGAMIGLADIFENQNRFEDAILWLDKARSLDDGRLSTRIRLFNLYMYVERFNSALILARELEQRFPHSPPVLEALGKVELANGRHDKAAAALARITRIEHDRADRLAAVAALQISARDTAGARKSLQQAIKIAPDYVSTYMILASIEWDSGNSEKAFELVAQIREIRPRSLSVATFEGDLMMRAKRFDEAVEAYARGIEIEETSDLAVHYYRARTRACDPTATEYLEDWTEKHPEDFNVRRVLAASYIRAERTELAIEHHERLMEEKPDDFGVSNNLAWLYQGRGDARAMTYAERAFELAPDNPAAIDTLGWILVQQGDPIRGLQLLRDAHARASTEVEVRYHLAVALDRLGRAEEARRELEAVVESGKDFDGAADARALLKKLNGG